MAAEHRPEEVRFVLNSLAAECYEISRDHGFHEGTETTERHAMRIALMHSELSEALEALRDEKYAEPLGEHSMVEEFADTIIRVLDASETLGLNIGKAVIEKMEKNRGRPYKHGRVAGI